MAAGAAAASARGPDEVAATCGRAGAGVAAAAATAREPCRLGKSQLHMSDAEIGDVESTESIEQLDSFVHGFVGA